MIIREWRINFKLSLMYLKNKTGLKKFLWVQTCWWKISSNYFYFGKINVIYNLIILHQKNFFREINWFFRIKLSLVSYERNYQSFLQMPQN